MGIFDDIKKAFLPQPMQQGMSIPSIMPLIAIQSIQKGILPQLNTRSIFLTNGETCHFIERAILVTEKNMITGYTGGSNGWSFRVLKGVNYRIGKRQGTPIRENVQEFTKGILYITNKRVIFTAKKNAIDKKVSTLTAITPFCDAITIQFGNNSYSLMLPDGNVVFNTLNLLKP